MNDKRLKDQWEQFGERYVTGYLGIPWKASYTLEDFPECEGRCKDLLDWKTGKDLGVKGCPVSFRNWIN